MDKKAGNWREVLANTEWVAIVTWDGQQPHTVATWGEYIRTLSEPDSDTMLIPVGGYRQTEVNLGQDKRVQVLLASRQVLGSQGRPGQGYLLEGEGEVQHSGPWAQRAKEHFPWSRGAFLIHVKRAQAQL